MREHLAKKHMRTGDYLDYGVEFYRQHLKTLLIFTAVFHVPVNFLISYLIGPSVLWEELLEAAEYGLTYDFVFRIYGGAALQSLYMSTFYYVLLLGIIYFTYHRIVWDKAYPVRFCLKQGLQRFGWVILWNFVLSTVLSLALSIVFLLFSFLLVGVGLAARSSWVPVAAVLLFVLCLLCAVIYVMIRTYFIPHAVVINRVNCFEAFKRSMRLTKRHFWRVFRPVLFGAWFTWTIPSVLSLTALIPIEDPLLNRILYAAAQAFGALFAPVLFVITTILYIRLQTEQGEIDFLVRLRAMLEADGGGAAV